MVYLTEFVIDRENFVLPWSIRKMLLGVLSSPGSGIVYLVFTCLLQGTSLHVEGSQCLQVR